MNFVALAAASAAVLALAGHGALAQTGQLSDQPKHYGKWGVDLSARDLSVRPGDDFFSYANGAWYAKAVIPADQPSLSVGYDVYNLSQVQLRKVIEAAARNPSKTPNAVKIGGLYNAFMDEARVERLDDRPLQADLARVKAISDQTRLGAFMGRSQGAFGASFFDASIDPDAKDPDHYVLFLSQAGLGMGERTYYLDAAYKAQKAAYEAYAARALKMAGWPEPEAAAHDILALETKIAEVSWPLADRRDTVKTYNPMSVAELQALAPGFPWSAMLEGAGLGGAERVVVSERSAFPRIAAVFAETPLETLKAYEAFHVINQASPYLSKRFVDSRFAFAGKSMQGLEQNLPRWKRGVGLVDRSLGEAVGQEYVARYFPPESKAKMEALVANLKTAMRGRIEKVDWMSPATKAQALEKLDRLNVMVGYPDKWRDYSGLKIDAADLYGDVVRADAFEWAYHAAKLGQQVDKKEWLMTPQEVNAYNEGSRNVIVFPAAILQPPYFDPRADMAVNYGAIGGVIGHEITHGYDDQGRHFDSTGHLRDWWTAEDAARFEAEAKKLADQFDGYEVAGVHIKGRQTLGENLADVGGLLLGLDAYHASLNGRPAPVIDGLTGDQRVFLGWAQVWRSKQREESLRQRVATDVHSPARFRVIGPTRNVAAWYAAFDVKPGDKYYLKPEDRVRIW
jgi:putative endopeptidase